LGRIVGRLEVDIDYKIDGVKNDSVKNWFHYWNQIKVGRLEIDIDYKITATNIGNGDKELWIEWWL